MTSEAKGWFHRHREFWTLTQLFFPELFVPGNIRWGSSWFGGGVKIKEELDSVRKNIIRRYVKAFYPAAGKTSVWQDTIVSCTNEGLRRKVDKEGSSKKRPEEEKTSVIPLFSTMYSESSRQHCGGWEHCFHNSSADKGQKAHCGKWRQGWK